MTDQKGFDLIAYVMDELMSTERLQLVVAGTGEARYEEMLRYFAEKYPQKIHVTIGYSEEPCTPHLRLLRCVLMPSLFEPCGLSGDESSLRNRADRARDRRAERYGDAVQ